MANSEFFEAETTDENNEQGTESDTDSKKEILCAILRSLMLVDSNMLSWVSSLNELLHRWITKVSLGVRNSSTCI